MFLHRNFIKAHLRAGNLRYLIPEKIPFYVALATLPPPVLLDIIEILKLHLQNTVHIIYSNDCPEIQLMVRGLVCTASSFQDLAFLIPQSYQESDPPILPFLVFFDNTKEAEWACKYLQTLLPQSLWHKIRWFHLTMTQYFREDQVEAMKRGDVWGLCCTDAFGMVGSPFTCWVPLDANWNAGHGSPQCFNCGSVEGYMWYVHTLATVWMRCMRRRPNSDGHFVSWEKRYWRGTSIESRKSSEEERESKGGNWNQKKGGQWPNWYLASQTSCAARPSPKQQSSIFRSSQQWWIRYNPANTDFHCWCERGEESTLQQWCCSRKGRPSQEEQKKRAWTWGCNGWLCKCPTSMLRLSSDCSYSLLWEWLDT